MTMWLRQGTAATVTFGPFIDDTDGKTAETGLTTDYTLIYLAKNGGDLTAKADTTDLVHDLLGHYHCVLGTGDTDTLGRLRMAVHVAGSLPVWQDFMVVPANVYDSVVLGTDLLDTHVTEFTNGAITAAAIADAAIDNATFAADVGSTAYATNIIALAADKAILNYDAPTNTEMAAAFTEIKGATWAATDTLEAIHDDVSTVQGNVTTIMADTDLLDDAAGGIADIHTDIGTLTAELAKVPKSDAAVTWNATALASIQTECNDALIANNLDHLCLTATSAADMTTEVADNTIISRVIGNGDTSTFVPSTDGLHAAGVDLDAVIADIAAMATVDDIADGVWNELSTGHTDAGKAGTQIWTDVDAILEDTGTTLDTLIKDIPTNAELTTALGTADDAVLAVLGTAGAGLTAIPWNAAWDAEVQSECDDAITANTIISLVNDWVQNKLVRTDNGDGTITVVLYADNGTTPLKTWVFTTATGTRAAAS